MTDYTREILHEFYKSKMKDIKLEIIKKRNELTNMQQIEEMMDEKFHKQIKENKNKILLKDFYNEKLEELAQKRGIKWSALAHALNITDQTLRNKRAGRTKWTVTDVENVAMFFRIPITESCEIFFGTM